MTIEEFQKYLLEMSARNFNSYGKSLSSLPGLGPGEAPVDSSAALASDVRDLQSQVDRQGRSMSEALQVLYNICSKLINGEGADMDHESTHGTSNQVNSVVTV